jgi:NACHT domain
MADVALRTAKESDFPECLRWLSPIPVSQHHEMYSWNRISGTGNWLFDQPQYRDWNDSSSSSMLVLHGIPGCGKSSVASAVVDSIIPKSAGGSSFTPLAYFYCARNAFEIERSSPDDIMRSLVRQLSTLQSAPGKIHDAVFSAYEQRKAEAKLSGFDPRKLTLEECVDSILELTESNPAMIIIDAIDEVEKESQPILLNAFKKIIKESVNVIKVFVTTRTDSHILALLENELTIHVDSKNVKDGIERFTRHLLTVAIDEKRLLQGKVSDALRTEMENALVHSAGEM